MATLFAHAAVPAIAASALRWPAGLGRRVAIVAAVCACLPDLDVVTFLFERRPPELWSHGGIAHSLLAAALVGVVAAALFVRRLGTRSRDLRRIALFLFAATASHGLLDAMTDSELGVALFAPLDDARRALPWRPIPSPPLDLASYWGLLTLANELCYAVLPVVLVAGFVRASARGDREAARRTARTAALFLAGVLVLRTTLPEWFAPRAQRAVAPIGSPDAGDPADIPHDDLPGGRLAMRLDELRARGLFDRTLAPDRPVWSSSFFPSWFGGEAGRWKDGSARLAFRTLTGFSPPDEAEARRWLAAAAAGDPEAARRIASLAPTEKVDLAFGRLDFPATKQALGSSHNQRPLPRAWSGRCNGIATAALYAPEPFRAVDVVGASGATIRFHPNDVKALLSVAYYEQSSEVLVGRSCEQISFDAGARCSMSPAVLVLAIANRLGIARRSFLLDALPTAAKQYYPVASARLTLRSEPRPIGSTPIDPALAGRAAKLADVTIEVDLGSTTLPYARADVVDPSSTDGTRYRHVGVVPVARRYEATLALAADSELVGGRWTGDRPEGPDNVAFRSDDPALEGEDALAAADALSWSFVQELARASVDEGPDVPRINLRR